MIESATKWGRKTLERAREQTDGIATEVRQRVIEPVGEGLSAGAEAAASRVKRSGADPRVAAPMLVLAGLVGAIGATLIRRNRDKDGKTSPDEAVEAGTQGRSGDGTPSNANGHGGKARRQAAIRSK